MKFPIILLFTVALMSAATVEVDYRKEFGDDYDWAVRWLTNNDQLFEESAARYGVPAKELKAIIFPELVRYNRVFDVMQVESLKFLYVSEGPAYTDFSVGYFQMKPSFAEMVEKDAGVAFGFAGDTDDEAARKARIGRITTVAGQLRYLCAFYKICERRFPSFKKADPVERLKWFATAYNAGYDRDKKVLSALQRRNHFQGHNYSDVSIFYWPHE